MVKMLKDRLLPVSFRIFKGNWLNLLIVYNVFNCTSAFVHCCKRIFPFSEAIFSRLVNNF